MNVSPSLRPLTISSLLDRALHLYRAHCFAIVRPVALVQVAILVFRLLVRLPYGTAYDLDTYHAGLARMALLYISAIGDWVAAGPARRWDLFFIELFLLIMLSNYIIYTLTHAFANYAYGSMGMTGPQPIVGPSFYSHLTAVLLVLVGASGLCEWAAQATDATGLLQVSILGFRFLPALVSWQHIVLLMPIVLIGLTLYAAFCIGPQLVILEGCTALAGLRRSWRLVRPSFWRVLTYVLIVGLVTLLLATLPATIVVFSALQFGRADILPWLVIAAVGLSQIGMVAILPFQVGVFTLLYYDLRIRHEGYDLQVKHQQMTGAHYATLLREGDAKLAAADVAGAIAQYDQALVAFPDDIAALVRRGAARQRLGDYAGALADCQRVLARYPNEPQTLVNYGVTLQQMGHHAEALAQYQRALKTNPRFDPALYNVACLYAVQNDTTTALRYLKQAIQRHAAWREHACTDSDFESLRTDPRFVALTQRGKHAT